MKRIPARATGHDMPKTGKLDLYDLKRNAKAMPRKMNSDPPRRGFLQAMSSTSARINDGINWMRKCSNFLMRGSPPEKASRAKSDMKTIKAMANTLGIQMSLPASIVPSLSPIPSPFSRGNGNIRSRPLLVKRARPYPPPCPARCGSPMDCDIFLKTMAVFRKKGFWAAVAALILVFIAAFVFEKNDLAIQLSIGAGYQAKILCSAVFVSKRDPQIVLDEDVAIHPLMNFVSSRIDRDKKEVVSSTFGRFKARAVYLDKLGAVLLSSVPEETVRSWPARIPDPLPEDPASVAWPTGDLVNQAETPAGIDRAHLEKALDRVFIEPDLGPPLRTRAVIVLYQGQIVAERYAPGYFPDMPLIGWSMSKTVTAALAGIRVGEGKLSLKDPAPIPEWKSPGDRRGSITLEQLLWMATGLEFDEEYETKPVSDVNRMLFTKPDTAAYAAFLPLVADPGSVVHYSTGTTQIIARLIRQSFSSQEEYFAFPRRALFNRIGMRSALIEPDASGTLSSGAFVFASARDWARFGLLLLNGGMWEGQRVLPEGWVEFMTTPSPASAQGDYGAQTWLNRGPKGQPNERSYPSLPQDMFRLHGYQDQITVVIPSRQLVVVRLGTTTKGDFPLESFISDILKAMPNP